MRSSACATSGADKVVRWLAGALAKPESANLAFELRLVNGEHAIVVVDDELVDGVIFVTVENDRVTALHGIRNPEKLGAV